MRFTMRSIKRCSIISGPMGIIFPTPFPVPGSMERILKTTVWITGQVRTRNDFQGLGSFFFCLDPLSQTGNFRRYFHFEAFRVVKISGDFLIFEGEIPYWAAEARN
jgi:hypothetical protein